MELMAGEYIIAKMENMDSMAKAIDIPEDMMIKMLGAPGMVLEVIVNGFEMTMKRSDGMIMTFRIGEEFEMHMKNTRIQVTPRIQNNILGMVMTMPNGMTADRQYHFDQSGIMMDMYFKDIIMKAFYRRM